MTSKILLIISLIFFVILYTVFRNFKSDVAATNFLFGWVISLLNYYGLANKIKGGFENNITRALVFNSQFRLLLTAFVMVLWFKYYEVDITGLLVGLSVVAVCLPVSAIIAVRRKS
ncbi:ATP synthase subunit I [Deferribacterales bacterium Es71-Z0220]|uniref:ATP synthase subunit I n=1 Tax=Deferrivibrio essentukiensis TaxID=2880922 RepID=UPI0024182AA2|nr:ATP synthase subunit I [Deferrivibrio essentukiensis]MCB4205088.1 ATP synthase subunit I [Deferrivibrio essentukiensis]